MRPLTAPQELYRPKTVVDLSKMVPQETARQYEQKSPELGPLLYEVQLSRLIDGFHKGVSHGASLRTAKPTYHTLK